MESFFASEFEPVVDKFILLDGKSEVETTCTMTDTASVVHSAP